MNEDVPQDIDPQTMSMFKSHRRYEAELEARIKELEAREGVWEYFCRLPQGVRIRLTEQTSFTMCEEIAVLMSRPAEQHRYPGNDEQLQEQAGHYADMYKGGGWMAIRSLLINFHKHMLKLQSIAK